MTYDLSGTANWLVERPIERGFGYVVLYDTDQHEVARKVLQGLPDDRWLGSYYDLDNPPAETAYFAAADDASLLANALPRAWVINLHTKLILKKAVA